MTRDEIIRLARGAGFETIRFDGVEEVCVSSEQTSDGDGWHVQTKELERFADLIAKIEREKLQHQIDFLLKAYDSVSNQLSKATGKQSKDVREAIKARSKE